MNLNAVVSLAKCTVYAPAGQGCWLVSPAPRTVPGTEILAEDRLYPDLQARGVWKRIGGDRYSWKSVGE